MTQKSLILESVIRSQFHYCPKVWMFCSSQTNNMINKLHESALRIELNDQTSNFETLLAESRDACNYHGNIQTLMAEAYKIQNNLSAQTMKTMLERKIIPHNFKEPTRTCNANKQGSELCSGILKVGLSPEADLGLLQHPGWSAL